MIMTEKLYKIKVKSMEGNILTYNKVKSYEIKDGLLLFIDSKNNNIKAFPVINCEIDEVKSY